MWKAGASCGVGSGESWGMITTPAPAPDTIQTQTQDGLQLRPPPGHRGHQPPGPHRQRGHRQERQEGDCGGRAHHQPG